MGREQLLAPSDSASSPIPSAKLSPVAGLAESAAEEDLTIDPATELVDPSPSLEEFEDFDPPEKAPFFTRAAGFKATMMIADEIAALIGLAVTISLGFGLGSLEIWQQYLVVGLSLVTWPIAFAQQGLYHARHLSRRAEEMRRLVNAVVAGTVALAGLTSIAGASSLRNWMFASAASVLVSVGLVREAFRQIVKRRRETGRMTRRVILVGSNEEADEINRMLATSSELGYKVVGRVTDKVEDMSISDADLDTDDPTELPPYLGHTDNILEIVRATRSSGVIVATTDIDLDAANRLVRVLTSEGLYVELTSAMRDIAARRVTIRPLGRYPVMSVEPINRTGWRALLKRGFDVVISTILLILLSPVLIASMLAIRITSGPNVLFRQQRVGRNGTVFTVFKLRTMVNNAEDLLPELADQNEASGPMFKMANDPRVTKVGGFLRRTSIDEVPQFINVLKGDMSLVGPRPALPHEALQWNDDLRERLRVQPGITGNWQVNGRFTASIEDYQRLDLYYVDNWSVVTDLVIMAKTIPAVLKRNGAA